MAEILVVGAGIGGSFSARLLAGAGHAVTLVERSPRAPRPGAGLVLSNSAVRTLAAGGVDVDPIAHRLRKLHVTGPDGRPRGGAGNRFALARPELVAALGEGLHRLVDVRFDTVLHEVRPDAGRVHCRIGTQEQPFDFVVAADGIRSTVRRALAPHVALRSAAQVCWRGIVEERFGDAATELWTGRERIGVVPLSGERSYVYVVRGAGTTGNVLTPADGVPGREAAAVEALRALPVDELLRHELEEVDRPVWGTSGVALLGDAAHAMTPNMGLGAALAIEDAAVLTSALRQGLPGAVGRYRRARAVRVRAVQLASRAIGVLAHGRHPAATRLRAAMGLEHRP
ncbi:2-polyprenyl-6-methoxyphenol hydroxylase [Blastococcus aggregatus]|uniref:2-polyprenyl-6-methoxyphenol hydroxylase n=1 Tax=Blastococcus aggregatus TaxID=38502 RepID=A0A285V641_9ACTN|nr:FAD-dependent monooxygenase [Blastococcus aggregatus]SOC49397.1 2-polyprenyl-6-methoxyphenol hydroxylase [Blastococcus aggregatus]